MRLLPATTRLATSLIAAAVVLLLGGQASADCGDYVQIRLNGQQVSPDHKQTMPADSPCAHGQCDRAPITPPAPETTAPTGGHDAVLAAVYTPTPTVGFSYLDSSGGTPSHIPSVPFDPPRI